MLTCSTFDTMFDTRLFFKCDNFQKSGSFKIRGATSAILRLSEKEASRGVVTHSSGNFAGALALAAGLQRIKAFVVMPENSRNVKKEAVAGYGAEITFCKPTLEARESTAREIIDKTGATFLHPYNNYDVVAGQGTAALELLEDVGDLDIVIAPIGGGGLMSGTAITVSSMFPEAQLIGAEPAGADDAYRSLKEGKIIPSVNPRTIADGLLTSLGDLTYPIIRELVSEIITVSEDQIIKAMRMIWERMKIVVEPSAAVTLAVILAKPETFRGIKAGLILSGGNADLDNLPW